MNESLLVYLLKDSPEQVLMAGDVNASGHLQLLLVPQLVLLIHSHLLAQTLIARVSGDQEQALGEARISGTDRQTTAAQCMHLPGFYYQERYPLW